MVPRKILPQGRTRMGFTLIELLVVIAIIAILAAILFPVFAKAREKAHQAQCVSHQRQLAMAIMMAAQNNDETLPRPDTWIVAANLSSDPKIFNCPSNSHKGVPSDPDYGMNAYLFSLVNGQEEGLALGDIADPTTVQLTVDLKAISPDPIAAVALDPTNYPLLTSEMMTAIKQRAVNPFPRSFTCTGLGAGNGDQRHSDAAIASYVDGHVGMMKGMSTAIGMYCLPSGNGGMAVDFSNYSPDAVGYQQAKYSLAAAVGWDYWHPDNGVGANAGQPAAGSNITNGWTITGPGSLTFGYGNVLNPWLDMTGPCHSMSIEGTLSSGAVLAHGCIDVSIESISVPADGGTLERQAVNKSIVIDNVNGFIQGGQMKGFSNANYTDYTAGNWIDLPVQMAGKRLTTSSAVTNFRLEVTTNYGGGELVNFPTEDVIWNYDNTRSFNAKCVVKTPVVFKVVTPISTYSYTDVAYPYYYGSVWGKFLSVRSGTLTINKITYCTYAAN